MPRRELATAGVLAQNKMILKVDLYSLISELLCYTCNSPALHLSGCQHPPPPPPWARSRTGSSTQTSQAVLTDAKLH